MIEPGRIPVPDAAAIPAALKAMRGAHTVRRRDVAYALGMWEQQYGQYELGNRVPSVEVLARIAHAMGYDLALVPRSGDA